MSHLLRRISAVSFGLLLAACGGGGGSTSEGTNSQDNLESKQLPYAPYTVASVRSAPADGATLSGIVRLEISGYHIRNVQLLPPQGYSPVYGRFNNVWGYGFEGENGFLDLDTTKLPNGPIQLRIVAFDYTRDNQEVVLMSPRTWNISNSGTPSQLSASLAAAPANGAIINGTRRLEVRGTGLANVELLPPTGYSPKLGVFNVSADRTYAWLDLDTRSLPDGAHNVRISAFNVMAGQPGAREVVVMRSRQWNVRNGTDPNFTAELLMAPVHDETLTGPIRFDVRGTGIENIELLPASGYEPKYGKFHVYGTEHGGYFVFDPTTLPPGVHEFRISAFNRPAGAADAQEIVIMPARKWNIQY